MSLQSMFSSRSLSILFKSLLIACAVASIGFPHSNLIVFTDRQYTRQLVKRRRLQNVSKTAVECRGFQETRENEAALVTD
jgi:hypothetical protein